MRIEIPIPLLGAIGFSPLMFHNKPGSGMGTFIRRMYAKVFQQIFDSSISEDYRVRFVFEDMLKLANVDGVVDMTHEAISRRTNVPLEIVQLGISNLESPDPKSRSKEHEGRRIVRLDDHRDWGWFIVNYHHYRDLVSEEQRREKTKIRTRKWREKKAGDAAVTLGDAAVTPCAQSDAMEREREKQIEEEEGEGVRALSEIPSWDEFWGYCQTQACLLPAEWYAKDKWERANMSNWKDKANWRAYARVVKGWWESDGRPMTPQKGKYAPKPPAENPRNFGMPSTGRQAGERAVAELKARGDIK